LPGKQEVAGLVHRERAIARLAYIVNWRVPRVLATFAG